MRVITLSLPCITKDNSTYDCGKTPFALLVAFGGVGDADARGGGEPEPRTVAFKPKAVGRDKVFAVE